MRALYHADVQAPQETTLHLACCKCIDLYSALMFGHINLVTHAHITRTYQPCDTRTYHTHISTL